MVEKLVAAAQQALADPSLQKRFAELGGEIKPMSPEELGAYVKAENEKWAKVVKSANLKLE